MTDTHRAPASDPAPPVPPHSFATADDAAHGAAPPEPESQEIAPPQEPERYIWQPPVPQFPPRPSQAPPVQYQGPQMQPAPAYTPQGTPDQQGQPQGQQVPYTYAPQGQQGQYAPPAPPLPQYPQPPMQSAPAYSPPMYTPPTQIYAPPPSPGTSRVRVGRRFARRAVRSMGGVGKVFSGARLPVAVLVLLLLGLIGWLGTDKMNTARAPKPAPNAVSNGTIVLPAEATVVQNYINATKNDDVELGWNTLSAKEKARRLDKGEDKTVMKAYVDTLSQNQVTPNYRFVGAYGFVSPTDFSQGGIYYYIQEYAISGRASSRPMFFVVDTSGKVDQVYDWLYQAVVSSAAQSSTASGSSSGP